MKKQWPLWLKWAIPAVCLCAALLLTVPLLSRGTETSFPDLSPASSGEEYEPDTPGGCEPPHVIVDGRKFYIASRTQTLPEGFVCAGTTSYGSKYYANPEMPEEIYVYEMYMHINQVDSAGNVVGTMPVYRYSQYVDLQ